MTVFLGRTQIATSSLLPVLSGCGNSAIDPPLDADATSRLEEPVGAFAMPDGFAAEAAAGVLQQGGNAVDAAIAAAAALRARR